MNLCDLYSLGLILFSVFDHSLMFRPMTLDTEFTNMAYSFSQKYTQCFVLDRSMGNVTEGIAEGGDVCIAGYTESSEELLAEALQTCLTQYNESTSQRLELVFFSEAVHHAARLSRVFVSVSFFSACSSVCVLISVSLSACVSASVSLFVTAVVVFHCL